MTSSTPTASDPAVSAPLPRRVYLVSHTHWDREWYHAAPRFRQRLMALIDALLAPGPPDVPTRPFLLDGQAITLRDYLAVRPQAAPALAAALRRGQVEAGPWFVLADNLIPSGEAIVRNLEAGRRVLSELGATAPTVAYCPDTFGHPAALPLIANGFGLPVAVVWRGAGGSTHPTGDAFHWESSDGSRVVTHHLPPDGYEYGSAIPSHIEAAREKWAQWNVVWDARNRTGVVLLLNGADHHARQPDLAAATATLEAIAAGEARVEPSSLRHWAERFAQAANATSLPLLRGELRDSYGYTWTLAGTIGTRAHQKRRNALLERGLLRDVEPWLALVRLHDRSGLAAAVSTDAHLTMAQLPSLLNRAWEDLLTTHPHDSLCGCSTDAVARALNMQQELVAEQGKGLREAALQLALAHNPVAARSRSDVDWRRVVVRNRGARVRGGVATVHLLDTIADAPVGPGSVPPVMPTQSTPIGVRIPALDTGAWTSQVLSSRVRFARRESPQHYPDNDLVREQRTLIWMPPVPAFGVRAVQPHELGSQPSTPPFPVTVRPTANGIQIDNGRLQLHLTLASDAAPSVALQVDDRTLPHMLAFETQHDAGDSYTPALRGHAEWLQCTSARLLRSGPLRATVRLTWRVPPERTKGARPGTARGPLTIVTDLSVDAMSAVLLCEVHGRSQRTDHRTRLVWRTDVWDGAVWADAAFGPVVRTVPIAPATTHEQVVCTMPMHRWTTHANAMFGATMIADGLAEAEVTDGALALTLLRGIGELSRADLSERPGHAGWPASVPDAQSMGRFSARTALFLHGPMSDDVLGRVRDACDDVLLPLTGESWRDLAEDTPPELRGPQLVGEAFEASAVTVSHTDHRAIVLRALNLTSRAASGMWHLPDPGPWVVTPCRLDEQPVAESFVAGAHIGIEAGAHAVTTVLVRRAR